MRGGLDGGDAFQHLDEVALRFGLGGQVERHPFPDRAGGCPQQDHDGCDDGEQGQRDGEVDELPAPTVAPTEPVDPEAARLLADCTILQFTVWEGDQFIGVEYPADGEPFTDSLREAIEISRDFFSFEVPQMQSQLAIGAFAQYYAEWDSLLQAGIYTSTNIGAVTEAGFAALAPLQAACS